MRGPKDARAPAARARRTLRRGDRRDPRRLRRSRTGKTSNHSFLLSLDEEMVWPAVGAAGASGVRSLLKGP